MLIDIHAHITSALLPAFVKSLNRKVFDVKVLLKRMDLEGIDKSVLLPLTNPENHDYYAVADNMECLKAAKAHPDRLMSFCCVDPRFMMNNARGGIINFLRAYKDMGALGIGEMCAGLPFDHKLCQRLYEHAGEEQMPMLFHLISKPNRAYGLTDDLKLPRMENALRDFPDTIFIGHAPAFWNEIDGNLTEKIRDTYVKGPITRKGRLWKLMEQYPNLHADVSAGSGHNALSRDPAVGYEFLEKFSSKIFFGTDRFTSSDEPIPGIIGFLKDGVKDRKLSKAAYEKIAHSNFERVFLKKP